MNPDRDETADRVVPIVEGQGLSNHSGDAAALRDVHLSVRPGTVHVLVGESGAGKSTLANVVAGVHSPDAGTLLVNGREWHYQ